MDHDAAAAVAARGAVAALLEAELTAKA
jgi:hypothetical protein